MEWFLVRPGYEAALQAELEAAGHGVTARAPGALAVDRDPWPCDPAFALQALPGATLVSGGSVGELVRQAFDLLAGPLDQAGAWSLHALATDAEDAALGSRAALLGRELLARFERLRKRTWRRRVAGEGPWTDGPPHLAQVVLVRSGELLVSCAAPRPLPLAGWDADPRWPGGRRELPQDLTPPSSAWRKAEEAYLLLGEAPGPGQRCLDLGACPGGWSWTALRRGARVLAVDRSPLEPPVSGHPLLEERRGDAFRCEPEPGAPPFDWLLCDVAAAPARTCELLERWLAARACRRFVVNVKFTGEERLPGLTRLRQVLASHPVEARVKHLTADKNEVTALGMVRTA